MLEIGRRDVAHPAQGAQHQEVGVERAGVFGLVGEGLVELLVDAQLRPGVAEAAEGLELGGRSGVGGVGLGGGEDAAVLPCDVGEELGQRAEGGRLAGLFAIADAPRPTAAAAVRALQARGVRVAMLTGDNEATAQRVAAALGIDLVLADVLPGEKAAKVAELQRGGDRVGMVGDGINDAPALAQADVGFAIGAGTDVAIESAQVVLMKSDPQDVVGAVGLSRATVRKMHQNLWWAVGYNVVAFPLAAGVFHPFVLSPELAALSMSGSSALVAINALLLKRARVEGLEPQRELATA